MTKKKPEVCVIWRDCEDGSTWMGPKEAEQFAEQECLVRSRGILVKKSKNFLVLAADDTLSGNNPGEYGRVCKIPRKMIVSILEVPDAPDYVPPVAPVPTPRATSRKPVSSHDSSQPQSHEQPDEHKD